jgi:hypothetical protein
MNSPPATRPLTPETRIPPRFVVTLDAPLDPRVSPLRVPLAITGQWVRGASRFTITRRDLEEIVRNFRERQNGEINVDYDHASEMPEVAAGGPIPSAGRIVRLDAPESLGAIQESPPQNTRYILWGWYEPTERARLLLKSREYRYLSPAIDWAARSKVSGKPQGTTLTSVALTNRPFLEELPQIRLSDPAFRLVGEPAQLAGPRQNPKSAIANSGGPMKEVTVSVADGKIQIMHEDFAEAYFAEPAELRRCLDEAGAPAAMLRGQEITLAQASALLSEAEADGKSIPAREFFRAQVDRELEEAVKTGRILPRQRDDWRKIALADFPTFRKVLGAQKAQVPLQPLGFSGAGPADVRAHVKFLAEQRMRERQITFGQALSEIGREQPDLVQQYRRAVSGKDE